MKRFNVLLLIAALLGAVSCSRYDKRAVQVAEDYAQQYICPFFEDGKLSDHMKVKEYRWEKPHRFAHKFDYNALFLDRESKLSKPYAYSADNKTKDDLLVEALQLSAWDAIRADTTHQALCVVYVSIDGTGSYPPSFDIIVSKDYKVMNPPIDLQKIEQELMPKPKENEHKPTKRSPYQDAIDSEYELLEELTKASGQ